MPDSVAPPRQRNVLSRFLLTLHLLPRPVGETPQPPVCVCGHPPHGIEPHIKPFLPRSPPEPEFEDWPEDTSEVEYPVPAYSPPRVSPMYRHVRYEVVGPTPAPWTEAAESWVACERAHDHFLVKVRFGMHKRVYCLPWRGERTTFGHIKAKFAHDIYKHLGLGPVFLELWVRGHRVSDHEVPAAHGVKDRDMIECRPVPQLLRKPLPLYTDVPPLPLVSYEALYPALDAGLNGADKQQASQGSDTRPGRESGMATSNRSCEFGERPKLNSYPAFHGVNKSGSRAGGDCMPAATSLNHSRRSSATSTYSSGVTSPNISVCSSEATE